MSVRIERIVTGEDQVILHISGRITEDIMATLRETKWVIGGRSGAAVRLGLKPDNPYR